MVTADGSLMQSHASLRPAHGGAINARNVLSVLLFMVASVAAIASAVVAVFYGDTTMAIIIGLIAGAIFAALIV